MYHNDLSIGQDVTGKVSLICIAKHTAGLHTLNEIYYFLTQ